MAAYVAPKPLVARALAAGTGVAYRFEETALRNIGRRLAPSLPAEWRTIRPAFIDVGQREWADELREGWYPIEANGVRWMKQRASLVLGVPQNGRRSLSVAGYCPRDLLEPPQVLRVKVGTTQVGEITIERGNSSFERVFDVPEEALRGEEAVVALEAARRFELPGDERELAAVFGRIGFR
jgi:hypothetical protein